MTLVKICGITTHAALEACQKQGADFIGLTFVAASPRAVTLEQAAALRQAATLLKTVALVCDASDDALDAIATTVQPDIWQCHGHETPERLAAMKARYGRPIMKAFPIATADDVRQIPDYLPIIDWILLDAKPPAGAITTGGHSQVFDWALLDGWQAPKPWLLAGGLTPANVRSAIARAHPTGVDVASGVEAARGEKSIAKIADFLAQVRS